MYGTIEKNNMKVFQNMVKRDIFIKQECIQ